jgi:hypothetical protein
MADLAYDPERGAELKANVDEVLAEIKAVAPVGSDVSWLWGGEEGKKAGRGGGWSGGVDE